jgi:hypothetical protein
VSGLASTGTIALAPKPATNIGAATFQGVQLERIDRVHRRRNDRDSALGPPARCSSSAAIEAACGADALVPKKFGCVSGSRALSRTKNVVLPPSAAETSGLRRTQVRS